MLGYFKISIFKKLKLEIFNLIVEMRDQKILTSFLRWSMNLKALIMDCLSCIKQLVIVMGELNDCGHKSLDCCPHL